MRPLALLAVVLGVLAVAAPARGIPPYARRYGMSCSTCHVGGPFKLSQFGEAFRDNGYRIPGDDAAYLREPPVALGDPERARLFPRTMWPGELPAQLPLGVAGFGRINGSIPQEAPMSPRPTLQLSASVLLLLGASLGEHVTAFGVIFGGTNGFGLAQLFLVGRSLFDRAIGEGTLNLKVGRFTPDIFAVQPQLARSLQTPLPLTIAGRAGGGGLGSSSEGIELWGLVGGRLKWAAGVVNGNKPLDDVDTRRDLFARLAVKLGGDRMDYRGLTPGHGDATTFGLGAFVYWGAEVLPAGMMNVPPRITNNLGRVGGDLRLRSHGVDVLGQVVLGRDENVDGMSRRVQFVTWSGEVDAEVFPWLQPYVRFEEAWFNPDAGVDPKLVPLDRRRLVVGIAFFIRANLRVVVEGVAALLERGTIKGEADVVTGDLMFAM